MSNEHQPTLSAHDIDPQVLAILTAAYGRNNADPNTIVETIVVRNAPKPVKDSKPSKLAAIKAAKDQESATICGKGVDARPAPVVPALAKAKTLDARKFFAAMRNAKSREESIQAIAGYMGYDRAKDYGAQELAARLAANRELKASTVPTTSATIGEHIIRDSHPSTAQGMVGYVAGLPDATEKKLACLKGKQRMAEESIGEHESIAANEETDPSDRHYHAELAKVERARLETIQEDIRRISATR